MKSRLIVPDSEARNTELHSKAPARGCPGGFDAPTQAYVVVRRGVRRGDNKDGPKKATWYKAAGIGRRSSLTWMTKCPLTPRGVWVLCYTKGRVLGGLIFPMFREILGAIILIADPEKVRETLALLESEPGIGHVTHD